MLFKVGEKIYRLSPLQVLFYVIDLIIGWILHRQGIEWVFTGEHAKSFFEGYKAVGQGLELHVMGGFVTKSILISESFSSGQTSFWFRIISFNGW